MDSYRLPAIAAGAVIGAALVVSPAADARMVAVAAIVALLAWIARRRDATLGTLVVLALATGAADARIQLQRQPQVVAGRTARYSGTVLGDVRTGDGLSSTFAFGLDGGPAMLAQAGGPAPQTGAHLRLRARLEPFDDARNPGEPREIDLERERGLTGRLASGQILAVLPPADDPRALLARARGWALSTVRERLPEPDASLIAGALWGERAALPPDLRAEFQETGTVHVLVTAGLHLGVVVALVLGLLAALRAPRVATCGIAIGAAWTYALVAGAHIPSVRAATMLSFALLARAWGRKALGWHAYAGAALLLTLARPLDVGGASFALSFACVGAILALAGPLDRALATRWALPDRVREALAMAVATQAGTWPVGAAVFLQFSPYAVLANVAVVPVVGGAMLFALAQLAFGRLPPLAQACANLCDWCVIWMLAVVRSVSSLPYARLPMTPAPAWCIALYLVALLALPLGLRRGRAGLAFAALAGAAALVLWPPRVPDARLRVTVLDVGQADAIVVQTPGGHTLLIDAGGQLERGVQTSGDSSAERVGERIVVPFLLRNGIHAVDALILSHPHGDHAGGMAPALRALRVGELADSGQIYGGSAYRDALATARADGVPVVYPRAGAVWHDDDGVVLSFIGPELPFLAHTGNDINDNSIAFVLEYRSFRMLFTGDAGVAAERRFLAGDTDLRATVLKVGHHGSAYSTSDAFLAAVRPRYAIVSVGRHNHFGHPAPRTLAALHRIGAIVYRTDRDGAITVSTDGAATTLSAMEPLPRSERHDDPREVDLTNDRRAFVAEQTDREVGGLREIDDFERQPGIDHRIRRDQAHLVGADAVDRRPRRLGDGAHRAGAVQQNRAEAELIDRRSAQGRRLGIVERERLLEHRHEALTAMRDHRRTAAPVDRHAGVGAFYDIHARVRRPPETVVEDEPLRRRPLPLEHRHSRGVRRDVRPGEDERHPGWWKSRRRLGLRRSGRDDREKCCEHRRTTHAHTIPSGSDPGNRDGADDSPVLHNRRIHWKRRIDAIRPISGGRHVS